MDNENQSKCNVFDPGSIKKSLEEIEISIVKTYRKAIWAKFIKALKEFNLIEKGDKIAVAISGGKDSMLMAKLFQELQKYSEFEFQLEFIVADPGYHPHIKQLLIENCKYLNIPINIFQSGIFEITNRIAKDYPCFMCAKMRRGALYSKAKELGCNKLALGHHFNDVIETTMLNVLYNGSFKTMLPKLKSDNFEGIELIRPLYFIEEKDIERFTKNSGLLPLNCACMVAAKKIGNKRYEVKDLIKEMKIKNKFVDKNIFKAAQNANLDALLGWQRDNTKYSYLDFYENENTKDR